MTSSLGILTVADEQPDRVALTCRDSVLSFGDLSARVASAAARVAAEIPAPEGPLDFLPILVDRSPEALVAFHAALWAGRAFAPLDPFAPAGRLTETFDRLGRPAVCIIAQPEFAEFLPPTIRPIVLDGAETRRIEPVPVRPDAPGYVIFTSGSTGRSKAVVRRWNSFNRWFDRGGEPNVAPDSGPWNVGVLQPLHFGGSHRAMVLIGHGYTVHWADPAQLTAAELLAWFDRRRIQESTLSDTQINSLAGAPHRKHQLSDLRFVRTGSEATDWPTIERLRRLASPDLFISVGYAASEAARSFNFVITPSDPIGSGRVPLGTPSDTGRVRLEPIADNPHLEQLVLTDPSMFGYLDDPDLRAERFFTDAEGRTWWRSGDIAERDNDGLWHHRGRIDDMVKINGLLVEPREAERVIAAIPGIRAVAVIPHTTRSGKARLVAHVSLDDSTLTPESVQAVLLASLPRHLIPSLLVRHDELPAGDRSKLDRPKLRSSALTPWRSQPPRSTDDEVELWLLGRLGELLELADIAPDDDLWFLGLDSLGAVEVCAWVSDAGFGELEPPQLLEHRTAASLARLLRTRFAGNSSHVVTLNGGGQQQPWFVIPGGGGTSLAFRALADELGADQPVVVIEPKGLHQRALPDRTVVAMARRARRVIEHRSDNNTVVLLGYSAGTTIAFEVARQLRHRGRSVFLVFLDGSVRDETRRQLDEPGMIGSKRKQRATLGARVRSRAALIRAYLPHLPLVRSNFDDRHYWRFRVIT
ncbi:MAG: hypothetical protein RL219_1736, partial [Actinomycetota bacterium]